MEESDKLLITKLDGRILTAWSEEGRIRQLQAESADAAGILGNIYVGKVKNIVKNLNAAFVEFQKGQIGYLPLHAGTCPIQTDSVIHIHKGKRVLIGDEILVQVSKEAVKTKPPTLSGILEFPGKYVILKAGNPAINISHKIKEKDVRSRLQNLLEKYCREGSSIFFDREGSEDSPKVFDQNYCAGSFGLLARTNAAMASDQEMVQEIQCLEKSCRDTIESGMHRASFSCLRQSPAGYLLSIQDMYREKLREAVTDSEEIYESILAFLADKEWGGMVFPVLWDTAWGKLDAVYNLSKTLKSALQPKVWLKSGAYLVIQPTEALVSIDVNTGKAVSKKKDVQKNFLKVNLEAAREIAVQLRLRNLSGIILVDFIDMESSGANEELLHIFRQELAKDPVPARAIDMTKLGLVEVTRKKVRKPLYEQMGTAGK